MTIMGEHTPILISVLSFLFIFLTSLGILHYFHGLKKKRALKGRIRGTRGVVMPALAKDSPSNSSNGVKDLILNILSSIGLGVARKKATDYSKMRPKFLQAGFRRENAQAVFWGAKCLFAILLPIGFFFVPLSYEKLLSIQGTVAIFIFLSFTGFILPDLWLRRKIKKRKQRLFRGFPDALDLLVVCVEAGMGLDSAINRVAEEIRLTNKTLSYELRLLNLELRAGKPRRDALSDLAMRTDLEDVKSLTTLLIQADKFGTNVANSLRVYSDSFRTKRFQKAEEVAEKIPIKLLLPLIFCIFPALFIVILGPAAIRIYDAIQFLQQQ